MKTYLAHGGQLLALVLVLGLISVLVAGCGGSGPSASGTRLQVAITDQSGTYAQVVLAIKEIRVVPAGLADAETGDSLPLIAAFDPSKVVDVLTLAYQQEVLGEATVPAGDYEQVRLVLEANPASGDPVNYVTLPDAPETKIPLKTPSGQESGLKIVGKFTVTPGILNAIALDFNPEKSIVTAGNSGQHILKPTGIRTVQLDQVLPTYGALAGNLLPAEVWPDAIVSVVPQGSSNAIAAGSVNPDDGSFRAMVPPGTYSVKVTAPNYNPYDSGPVFVVVQGADTAVGTITLNNNGTLTGTIMPAEAWPTAQVAVIPSGGGAAVATVGVDSAGAFSAEVAPGDYTLQVTATGYDPYDSALLVPPVTYTVVAVTATAVGTITLTPTPAP